MPTYRIGAEVRVRGTFTVELGDSEDIEDYVNNLEQDDLELLAHLTDNAFDASDAEVDDVAVQNEHGKFVALFFD